MSREDVILEAYGDLSAVTPDVAAELVDLADNLGLDPYVLANLIYYESGWRPQAVNSASGATGLIQFMPSTAERLGISTDLLLTLDAEDQLPWIAEYLRRQLASVQSRWTGTEADHYMLVFYPAAVGKPDYEFPSKVTDVNASETPADYAARVERHAADRYIKPVKTSTISARGKARTSGFVVLALVGAGLFLWTRTK